MKYLKAEQQATQFYFQIHMDETKVQEDGSPDPAYVVEYPWGLQPPGMTGEETPEEYEAMMVEYKAMMKREMELLVAHELNLRNQAQPEPIPLEGF